MILFELTGSERNPYYEALEVSNGGRQYDFLRSIVGAALDLNKPFISQTVVKALNFYAISCLHTNAGEYRPCSVVVGNEADPVGRYEAPEHYRVQALMDDFVNEVNRHWEKSEPIWLCSFVIWRLNWIHPFINGNGRTARAACYFVLCLKVGGFPAGSPILPELLRQERARYVSALKSADASMASGSIDLTEMCQLVTELLARQLASGQVRETT